MKTYRLDFVYELMPVYFCSAYNLEEALYKAEDAGYNLNNFVNYKVI